MRRPDQERLWPPAAVARDILTVVATAEASAPSASRSPLGRVSGTSAGLVAISGLALILRLATMSEQSYWLDESYTVHLVRLGLGPMLSTVPRTESTPPLYYVLAWFWTHVFGADEGGLRSLSALAGTGTVFAAGRLARRVAGARAALLAAGLLAVSPLLVWFSEEARAYALAALLTTGALLCLLAYAQEGRARALAGWAACAALALCTHYFTAFVILPGALWLLGSGHRRPAVRIALASVTIVALALLPLALAQRGTGHADYIGQSSLNTRILQVPKQLLIGYASPAQVITGVVALALVLAGAVWPWFARRRAWTVPTRLILASAATGVMLPILLALVGIDFLNTRNLLPVLPVLAVLAAAAMVSPAAGRWGPGCGLVLIALFAIVVTLVDTHVADQRTDWRSAIEALGPARITRVLVVAPADALLPVQAYAPSVRPLTGTAAVTELDLVSVGDRDSRTQPAEPLPSAGLPATFHRVLESVHPTYSLERYRSASPGPVTVAQAAALPVGLNRAVLIQKP